MIDSYIALDLETTGLEPKKEKITEIAALKVEHGQITGRFVTLVNPKRPLTERVVELTGITDDMLKDCLLYTSPSPRDQRGSRMPSSA